MVQWKQIQPVSMRMQVRSLASLMSRGSGIAMSCGIDHRCSLDPVLAVLYAGSCSSKSTPSLGTSICHRCSPKKTIKKKKKKFKANNKHKTRPPPGLNPKCLCPSLSGVLGKNADIGQFFTLTLVTVISAFCREAVF